MTNGAHVLSENRLSPAQLQRCRDERLQARFPVILGTLGAFLVMDAFLHVVAYQFPDFVWRASFNLARASVVLSASFLVARTTSFIPFIRFAYAGVIVFLFACDWFVLYWFRDPYSGYGGFWLNLILAGFTITSNHLYLAISTFGVAVTLPTLLVVPSENSRDTVNVLLITWFALIIVRWYVMPLNERNDQMRADDELLKHNLRATISELEEQIAEREESEANLRLKDKQLCENREIATQLARRASLAEMLAAIAHEVNQPLHAIVNYTRACNLLLADEDPELEKVRTWNSKLVGEANRAGRIIRRFRAFAERAEPHASPIELRSILHEALALNEVRLASSGVSAKVAEEDQGVVVCVDRLLVAQVFVNLVRNACEAMTNVSSERRMLIISIEEQRDFAQVSFSDCGEGLRAEDHADVFEAFVSARGDGLGLGLTICRSIVEAHGGRIWADPTQAVGSRFCLTLPLAGERKAGA